MIGKIGKLAKGRQDRSGSRKTSELSRTMKQPCLVGSLATSATRFENAYSAGAPVISVFGRATFRSANPFAVSFAFCK
jgi:hypothetical protein